MDLASIESFLAVGAHCDDVDIRVGGTFARLVREGKRGCYVVAVENAYVGSHYTVRDSRDALATRHQESTRAAHILGAGRVEWLQFNSHYIDLPAREIVYPDFRDPRALAERLQGALTTVLPPVAEAICFPECRERFRELVDDVKPQVIFTHCPDDRHPDHYQLCRFMDHMVRELSAEGQTLEMYFWEPGSGGPMSEYRPDTYIELAAADVAVKQRAIDVYASQFAPGALDGFAAGRTGAYGKLAGVPYAEAFRRAPFPQTHAWEAECAYFELLRQPPPPPAVHRL